MSLSVKLPLLPELCGIEDGAELQSTLRAKGASLSINTVNWPEPYSYAPEALCYVGRTAEAIYLSYAVKSCSVKAAYADDSSSVHKDSCVEFFMQQEGEELYRNFEFNAIGTCDASVRKSRTDSRSLTADEYASIKRYASMGTEPFEERVGETEWSVTVAIPFAVMGLDVSALPEKIKANLYICGDETKEPYFVSWNAIDLPEPNFHCPPFFGEMYL